MSIAARLKELVQAMGIGQSDLAREIGVSPGAVSEACSGKRPAPWGVVVGIANRYPEVSAQWLLTGRGSMYESAVREPPSPTYGDGRLREVQTRLRVWWLAASEEERAWLAVELRRRYPDVWGQAQGPPDGGAGGDAG